MDSLIRSIRGKVFGRPIFHPGAIIHEIFTPPFSSNRRIATTVTLAQPGSAFAAAGETNGKLPEPIAKLKSRKAEAKPITTAEREQRMERARQLMAENKIDAIMVMGGTSLVYFTNIRWWMSERSLR